MDVNITIYSSVTDDSDSEWESCLEFLETLACSTCPEPLTHRASHGDAAQINRRGWDRSSPWPPDPFPSALAGGVHRRPGRQERRQPEADPTEPPREDLDYGGRGRSLGGLQVGPPIDGLHFLFGFLDKAPRLRGGGLAQLVIKHFFQRLIIGWTGNWFWKI